MSPLQRVAGRATWLLSQVNGRAQALLAEAFAAAGIRGYHFRLLAALDQYGPSSQADLGRYTGIDRSDVVAALNELVEGGLARREPDRTDARRNVVTATRRGRSTLERVDAQLDEVQDEALAPLTPNERTQFVRLLAKLASPGSGEHPGGSLSGPAGV
jgi:MarR family transcriptional regulator, lower aerobic nicotinate degradation pathway regulator